MLLSCIAHQLVIWQQFRTFQHDIHSIYEQFAVDDKSAPTIQGPKWGIHMWRLRSLFWFFSNTLCVCVYHKHQQVNVTQHYTTNHICQGCPKVHHNHTEVVYYLKYLCTGCLARLIATIPAFTQEELASILQTEKEKRRQLRRKERTEGHKRHVIAAKGPHRPWPWENSPLHRLTQTYVPWHSNVEITPIWIHIAVKLAQQYNAAALLSHLEQQIPDAIVAATIYLNFLESIPSDKITALETYLLLESAVLQWLDPYDAELERGPNRPPLQTIMCMLQQIHRTNRPAIPHALPTTIRRQFLVDQLWLESNPVWQLRIQLQKGSPEQFKFKTRYTYTFSQIADDRETTKSILTCFCVTISCQDRSFCWTSYFPISTI